MKKLKTTALALITISFFSCGEPMKEGEVIKLNKNDSIEIFYYCYNEHSYPVILARFKSKPVLTVNQTIPSGKTTYTQATIIIENDSIIVLKK